MPTVRLIKQDKQVKLKKEIVTLGVPGVSPTKVVGKYVKPQDWNRIISDPEVVLIDTRNDYEYAIGTFKNAILTMARDFKAKTGSKITITSAYRSPADQDAIYARWLAAGGGPNNPTAGGITTPAKPLSAETIFSIAQPPRSIARK